MAKVSCLATLNDLSYLEKQEYLARWNHLNSQLQNKIRDDSRLVNEYCLNKLPMYWTFDWVIDEINLESKRHNDFIYVNAANICIAFLYHFFKNQGLNENMSIRLSKRYGIIFARCFYLSSTLDSNEIVNELKYLLL